MALAAVEGYPTVAGFSGPSRPLYQTQQRSSNSATDIDAIIFETK